MKIVIDAEVVIAAVRSANGASAEVLRIARRRELTVALSVPLVLEYEAKATLDDHLKAGGINAEQARAPIDVLVDLAEWTRVHFTYRPSVRDPDDEMVLETAINASAQAIVTFNIKDFGNAPAQFGIACLRPSELLERLK